MKITKNELKKLIREVLSENDSTYGNLKTEDVKKYLDFIENKLKELKTEMHDMISKDKKSKLMSEKLLLHIGDVNSKLGLITIELEELLPKMQKEIK